MSTSTGDEGVSEVKSDDICEAPSVETTTVRETTTAPDGGIDQAVDGGAAVVTTPVLGSDEEPASEAVSAKDDKICISCGENTGKYKCPKCRRLFCSVPCGKLHKETPHTTDPDPPAQPPPLKEALDNDAQPKDPHSPAAPRPQSQPQSRFSVLEQDPRMGQLFLKYPDLEDQLAIIEKAYRPPSYEERIRTGWTTEMGKANGMEALRVARLSHPGVEEYSELVTLLMSRGTDKPGGRARDMTSLTSRAEKDEIRRLMALEGQ